MKEEKNGKSQELDQHLKLLLSNVFKGLDHKSLVSIFKTGQQKKFKTGEYLFHEGDVKNEMYIVLEGRLRAIKENNGKKQTLGDIGAGDTVGELAFFSEEARMASVLAIRETLVLEFCPEKYMEIVAKDPLLARDLFKLVINRIRRNTFEKNKISPPKNIALISFEASDNLNILKKGVEAYFQNQDKEVTLYSSHNLMEMGDSKFFESLEKHEGINFLTCEIAEKEWTKQCLIYSDLVIVAKNFDSNESLHDFEKEFNLYDQGILHKRIYLLLIHQNQSENPRNTKRWLAQRPVDLHIHLRNNNQKDVERFCRIISNKANGLVLGGGGAKGFAHIGAVKALNEAGIDIDFIGGTSAGALYGVGMCYADYDFDLIRELNAEGIKRKLTSGDFAIPFISIKKGLKFRKYLKKIFNGRDMEDTWTTSFCVSTNLSRVKLEVFDRGPLWQKVLASMSIPGVFPPIVIDKNLHVDGGVMDNLPIEPIYKYPVDKIYAISLTSLEIREVNYEEVPDSFALLKDKIWGKKKYKIPNVASLVMNSLMVNSLQKQEATKKKVSHYFELDLQEIGLLDDKKWKDIIDQGYEQTKAYLKTIEH